MRRHIAPLPAFLKKCPTHRGPRSAPELQAARRMRYGQGRPIVMLLSEGRQATIKGGLDARCAAAHAVVAGQQALRPGRATSLSFALRSADWFA